MLSHGEEHGQPTMQDDDDDDDDDVDAAGWILTQQQQKVRVWVAIISLHYY